MESQVDGYMLVMGCRISMAVVFLCFFSALCRNKVGLMNLTTSVMPSFPSGCAFHARLS
jgi:hypothetical protein